MIVIRPDLARRSKHCQVDYSKDTKDVSMHRYKCTIYGYINIFVFFFAISVLDPFFSFPFFSPLSSDPGFLS